MPTIALYPALVEEDQLIQRTLNGDPDAFTPLILKYKNSLFDLACRILGNRTSAEDVLQDAFLEAYKHLAAFNHRARFSTWMYSIVLNRVRNHLRHNRVVHWSSLDAPRTNDEDSSVPEYPERGPSIQKNLEDKLDLEALQREVRLLPVRYQSIFIMYYFQQMSLVEVSQRLDRPLGTIKVYLHRARRRLYKRLTESQLHV